MKFKASFLYAKSLLAKAKELEDKLKEGRGMGK